MTCLAAEGFGCGGGARVGYGKMTESEVTSWKPFASGSDGLTFVMPNLGHEATAPGVLAIIVDSLLIRLV